MSHFAELDVNNTVLRVLVVTDSALAENGRFTEQMGIDFLKNMFGNDTIWKQTSYNSKRGIYYDPTTNQPHVDQTKVFRKNYAGIGYTFDSNRDAFINPKPVVDESVEQYVIFDEFSCIWSFNPPTIDINIGIHRV
jgi:hypothetical protein